MQSSRFVTHCGWQCPAHTGRTYAHADVRFQPLQLLLFLQAMEQACGTNNARSPVQVGRIPMDNHIRRTPDPVRLKTSPASSLTCTAFDQTGVMERV